MAVLTLILSIAISMVCYCHSTDAAPTIAYTTSTTFASTSTSATSTATTASEAPTLTQSPLFDNNHERDSFIMRLSSEIMDIKNMLNRMYGQINHLLPNPTIQGGTSQKGYVAFMVRLSDVLTGLGQDQIIHFDDVILNRGDGFDARLGVFRCPLAGTYQFSLSIGSYVGIQLEIVHNGQEIGRVVTFGSRFGRDVVDEEMNREKEGEKIEKRYLYDGFPTTAGWQGSWTTTTRTREGTTRGMDIIPGSGQVMVDLKVGDEVWVRHVSDNLHDTLFGNGMTTFSGHLLSLSQK